MLDITKDVVLPNKWQKRYRMMQVIVLFVFCIFILYASYQILFPPRVLNFNSNPIRINKNTMTEPKIVSGSPFERGKVSKGNTMQFYGDAIGQYSDIVLTLKLDQKSESIENDAISVKKSFQSFFYPIGQPMGFKGGSLLTSNGEFYIVSDEKLRKFSSSEIMQKLGFVKNTFQTVSPENLTSNQQGLPISDNNYPNGSLFKVDNNYYQLIDGKLNMFVSEKAFLTQFDAKMAIEKDKQFLSQFTLMEDFIGFLHLFPYS